MGFTEQYSNINKAIREKKYHTIGKYKNKKKKFKFRNTNWLSEDLQSLVRKSPKYPIILGYKS